MDLRNETKREKRWSCRRWYDLREIYFSRCNIRMRIEIRCRIMNFYLSYLYTVTIGGISSSIISSVPRNESPDICQSHTGNSINCSLFMPLFDKLSWQTIESNRVKSVRGNGDWSNPNFYSSRKERSERDFQNEVSILLSPLPPLAFSNYWKIVAITRSRIPSRRRGSEVEIEPGHAERTTFQPADVSRWYMQIAARDN